MPNVQWGQTIRPNNDWGQITRVWNRERFIMGLCVEMGASVLKKKPDLPHPFEENCSGGHACSWLTAVHSHWGTRWLEDTPQSWLVKIQARLPWSQRWQFTRLESPSPATTSSFWRRDVLTWSGLPRKESQSERTGLDAYQVSENNCKENSLWWRI